MTPPKELHDPARIPNIIGIVDPFKLIVDTAKKLLDGEIALDASRKGLEVCVNVAEIQGKAAAEYVPGDEIDIDAVKSLLQRGLPGLGDEFFNAPKNKFIGLAQEMLEALGVEESELINVTDKLMELTGGEKNLIIPITAITDEMLRRIAEGSATPVDVIKAATDATWQALVAPVTGCLHADVISEEWGLTTCPMCGSEPGMGRIIAEEGHFYLSCPLCLTEWKYPRLKCPWCGNEDLKKLGHFSAKEYPGYKVNFCRECNGYIKVIKEKTTNRRFAPVVDDLFTIELDIQAEREGFKKPRP